VTVVTVTVCLWHGTVSLVCDESVMMTLHTGWRHTHSTTHTGTGVVACHWIGGVVIGYRYSVDFFVKIRRKGGEDRL
jgi:hypothetical protein